VWTVWWRRLTLQHCGLAYSSEGAQVCRLVSNPTVKRDFAALLAGGEGDKRQVAALADLLERLTALDPDRCGHTV